MRIDELTKFVQTINKDQVIVDVDTNICKMLTPEGAVFDHANTRDMTNLAVASASLFKSSWRLASQNEAEKFIDWCMSSNPKNDRLLTLVVNPPIVTIKPRIPHLRLVK